MDTEWDVWISGRKWGQREGNERDMEAEEERNNHIREDFQKGENGPQDQSKMMLKMCSFSPAWERRHGVIWWKKQEEECQCFTMKKEAQRKTTE